MLIGPNIGLSRAWNTWSTRPAEMVFLPLGARVTPVLYATSTRRASLITAGQDITFGEHATDGSLIRFQTSHAGTGIDWAYDKADPWAFTGRWQGRAFGEWALRYWVTLCLSSETGEEARWDEGLSAAILSFGQRHVALVCDQAPVQVTAHASPGALAEDYETNGYFTKAARGSHAPCIALRFNLEMMPAARFAAAVADSIPLAVEKARTALAREAPAALPLHQGRAGGALDAIRDVMGWNTLWDGTNRRPWTAVSRIWHLGDFAVWYNDATFNALMCGLFDEALARDNMVAALASATPQGNIACIATSNDIWVDRSQAPHGALMAWLMFLRAGDRSLLELCYPALAANQRWWRAHRDPEGIGLVSCGSSDVGDGLYKGSHFGARNETGMDNSPTHDEAVWNPETRTLSLIDLGLNCALALDAEMLAKIATELGHSEDAAEFTVLAGSSRAKIRSELWDESRKIFANRQRGGGFVRSVGPTSFYPMLCGAASPEQAEHLIAHLENPETFGGEWVIPNVSRDDPAFGDNVYWRGRIWANVNWFTWQALRREGRLNEARRFADKSLRLFMKNWSARIAAENYNATTGEGQDQLDADPFYAWAAMLPLIALGEVMDVSPWHGWEITLTGEDVNLGPVLMPPGRVTLTCRGDSMHLSRGAEALFGTDGWRGRLTQIAAGPDRISLDLWPEGEGQGTLIPPPAFDTAYLFVNGEAQPRGPREIPLTGLGPGSRITLIRSSALTGVIASEEVRQDR
ncbi:MGH1-like glycoside hydrolase domain-containing protein [Pseudogemmobacter humi]|uniref:Glucosidase YgjK n=1 Tax=Pseudogemmobacter humi TaxID=2483812 RepID=A0A3P5WWU3_9RHOB|nr:trehalase family glycosidase [Pseudogemmobacter humi]VDC19939.1 Glucosidase YgjK precursor [Pseudogemmobacter humi]